MEFNILALVEAGNIKAEDGTLGLMQCVSLEHANAIADWLCLATGTRVELRLIGFGGPQQIVRTPETVKVSEIRTIG